MAVKKSPIVIVKNFIVVELAGVALYVIAGYAAHYAQIYRQLGVNQFLSFQVAQALFLFFAEVAIIFLIFFRWYRETLIVESDRIVFRSGLLVRHQMIIPLEHIASISYRQGPVGRLTRYGTIFVHDRELNRTVRFSDVAEPRAFVDRVMELRQLKTAMNGGEAAPGLQGLISQGEHDGLEFKTTLRWDIRAQKVSRDVEKSIMKTIAAFLNSRGGTLVIGVDDQRAVVGLECDFASLGKPNADGFENHFTHVFHNMIGAQFRQYVRLAFARIGDKECCIVRVAPSPVPVYLKADQDEEFYIRTGNGTTSLKFSEAAAYIDSRFQGELV